MNYRVKFLLYPFTILSAFFFVYYQRLMTPHLLQRIISGGQTGIDQLGLEVARSFSISTGGLAPKGYLTETGPAEWLRDYGLTEHTSSKYPPRTRANIQQSDGTIRWYETDTGYLPPGRKIAPGESDGRSVAGLDHRASDTGA